MIRPIDTFRAACTKLQSTDAMLLNAMQTAFEIRSGECSVLSALDRIEFRRHADLFYGPPAFLRKAPHCCSGHPASEYMPLARHMCRATEGFYAKLYEIAWVRDAANRYMKKHRSVPCYFLMDFATPNDQEAS
jgi:hypothetical protein